MTRWTPQSRYPFSAQPKHWSREGKNSVSGGDEWKTGLRAGKKCLEEGFLPLYNCLHSWHGWKGKGGWEGKQVFSAARAAFKTVGILSHFNETVSASCACTDSIWKSTKNLRITKHISQDIKPRWLKTLFPRRETKLAVQRAAGLWGHQNRGLKVVKGILWACLHSGKLAKSFRESGCLLQRVRLTDRNVGV